MMDYTRMMQSVDKDGVYDFRVSSPTLSSSSSGGGRRVRSCHGALAVASGWTVAALLALLMLSSAAVDHYSQSRTTFVNTTTTLRIGKHVASGSSRRPLVGLDGEDLHGVTVVSAFFEVPTGKKHTLQGQPLFSGQGLSIRELEIELPSHDPEYYDWLENFLGTVELPIVMYTSPKLAEVMLTRRGNKPMKLITKYTTAFEMPPMVELGGREWAEAHNKLDPEPHLHVPEVYGVWQSKAWMVAENSRTNPFNTKYFAWVDAGAFRFHGVMHPFTAMPAKLDAIFLTVPQDTVVLATTLFPFDDGTEYVKGATLRGEMDRADCHIQGGWYAATKEGATWWERETMRTTQLQSGLVRFAGKEQDTWTHTARLNWPKIYVLNMLKATGNCGLHWFTFQWFSDGAECTIPVWNGPAYHQAELASINSQPALQSKRAVALR